MWHCLNRDSELQLCQSFLFFFPPDKTCVAPTDSNSLSLLHAPCTFCCSPSTWRTLEGWQDVPALGLELIWTCIIPMPAAARDSIECSEWGVDLGSVHPAGKRFQGLTWPISVWLSSSSQLNLSFHTAHILKDISSIQLRWKYIFFWPLSQARHRRGWPQQWSL